MADLDEALRRADANALEAYRGLPAGSLDIFTVQCVTKAALASLAHQGWVLVPREATLDMSIAFGEAFYSKRRHIDDDDISDWWGAMIAAAPKAGGSE